jgi:hypothetical protein
MLFHLVGKNPVYYDLKGRNIPECGVER